MVESYLYRCKEHMTISSLQCDVIIRSCIMGMLIKLFGKKLVGFGNNTLDHCPDPISGDKTMLGLDILSS